MSKIGIRDPMAVKAIKKAELEHGLPAGSIRGPSRVRAITRGRRYAAWLMRHLLGMSYDNIGFHLDKDHTSVITMLEKLKEQR